MSPSGSESLSLSAYGPLPEGPGPTSVGPAPVGAQRVAPTPRASAAAPLDDQRLAELFAGAAKVLWTIAASVLGDATGADDVLQESWLIALRKRHQLRADGDFRQWMARIVRFVALNHLRRQVRRRAESSAALEDAAGPVGAETPLDVSAEWGEDTGLFDDELSAALAGLRPVVRACLLLKVVQELEYGEIAATLGIPPGTAMSHVHRARAALRTQLEPDRPQSRSEVAG